MLDFKLKSTGLELHMMYIIAQSYSTFQITVKELACIIYFVLVSLTPQSMMSLFYLWQFTSFFSLSCFPILSLVSGYLQELIYKLNRVGQAIENNDVTAAGSVLGRNMDADWLQNVNVAFAKVKTIIILCSSFLQTFWVTDLSECLL